MTTKNHSSAGLFKAEPGTTVERATSVFRLERCELMGRACGAAARGDFRTTLELLRASDDGDPMQRSLEEPLVVAAAELASPSLTGYLASVVGAVNDRAADTIVATEAQRRLWPAVVGAIRDEMPGLWPYFGPAQAEDLLRQAVWATAGQALSAAVGQALAARGPMAALSLLADADRAALEDELDRIVTWEVTLQPSALTKAEHVVCTRLDLTAVIHNSLTIAPRVTTHLDPPAAKTPRAHIDWRQFSSDLSAWVLEDAQHLETWPPF